MKFAQLLLIANLVACISVPCSAITEPDAYKGATEPSTKVEVYGQGVRETAWQTPADEARGFHLPPGFVAELVAAEPQISKPLNMAFDHRGRLWVTCTIEYPYPAAEGTVPRDTIKILEDTNGDGSFETIKVFADGLNIPIGILPVEGGAICFSIPNIWLLKDTDGDDNVDERVKLLGPFDTTRDTHGMINALRQGSDGWIYACHGFNNRSSVTASDGSKVEMNSGNTFRFLPDGSRIEQFTTGQVNPFGMCSDEWGNWFSADCHSKPITALLAGACYPSFGRPHDGLGFAPSMMEHLHGSTAICGLEYYQAEQFPQAYRQLLYSGNVMTSRINCDSVVRQGATLQARELTDFMTSDDPWFRPVDIQQGPDGALYVADFYNKIIGHYEVPLTHPERDRESGRIWRIRYQGEGNSNASNKLYSTSDRSHLASSNSRSRHLAVEAELVNKAMARSELEKTAMDASTNIHLRQSAVEILTRRNQLSESMISRLLKAEPAPIVVQLLRVVCGLRDFSKQTTSNQQTILSAVVELLDHSNPEVVKASAESLGRWGSSQHLPILIRGALSTSKDDPVMLQAFRIAIRNVLQRDDQLVRQLPKRWSEGKNQVSNAEVQLLLGIMPAIASPSATQVLLEHIASQGEAATSELRTAAIEHASRNPDPKLLELLLKIVAESTQSDTLRRVEQLLQIANSYPPNTKNDSRPLRDMAQATLTEMITDIANRIDREGPSMQWLDGAGKSWGLEPRKCSDGQAVALLSSLVRGEQYVGTLQSEAFACPERLSLWIAGHNGPPDQADHRLNSVTLVSAASGQQLMQAFPPRSDVAVESTWDLKAIAGQNVRLRLVDGDNGNAYAWLGLTRVSIPSLQVGSITKQLAAIASLLKSGFGDSDTIRQLFATRLSPLQRASVISAALEGKGAFLASALAQQALSLGRSELVTEQLYSDNLTPESATKLAQELCRSATSTQQSILAQSLLKSDSGCELLAEILQSGWLNPAALRGAPTLLPKSLAADKRELLRKYFADAEAAGLDTTLVTQRLSQLDWKQVDAVRGKLLFTQHCASCHQLAGQGATIGPQLDGAIKRSVERMAEDILLPNLNVDKAFRSTTFLLEDGSIKSGLLKEENDQTIQLIGSDAKVVSFPATEVAERKQSEQSLMPANIAELLNNQQLADLLHFLIQK